MVLQFSVHLILQPLSWILLIRRSRSRWPTSFRFWDKPLVQALYINVELDGSSFRSPPGSQLNICPSSRLFTYMKWQHLLLLTICDSSRSALWLSRTLLFLKRNLLAKSLLVSTNIAGVCNIECTGTVSFIVQHWMIQILRRTNTQIYLHVKDEVVDRAVWTFINYWEGVLYVPRCDVGDDDSNLNLDTVMYLTFGNSTLLFVPSACHNCNHHHDPTLETMIVHVSIIH